MSISIKTENGIIKVANVGGSGGNSDAVILTKEEYDALPDTKLTDNKQYFVKDWSQSDESGGYNIDYIEQKTGNKYLGKDIYVCMYQFTRAGVPSNGVNVTSSDIPNLLEMEVITDIKYIRTDVALMVHVNGFFTNATTYFMSSAFSPSANANGKLIFEYTKKD